MTTWVRSYFEGVTYVWEIRDDNWISRSVELADKDARPLAAAALAEVVSARDTGGIEAVRAYEARYGVAPEKPIEVSTVPHEVITEAEFEQTWAEARRALT